MKNFRVDEKVKNFRHHYNSRAMSLDLQFEFVEVDPVIEEVEEEKEEFEFPLFGQVREGSTKITLKDDIDDKIEQSRPDLYYFAKYTEEEKVRIKSVAVSGEDVIKGSLEIPVDLCPWKVVDLSAHNEEIEKKRKKQRPGKKKRQEVIKCRERKLERLKVDKEIKLALKKKLMKKIHHKRGGKKNKKSVAPKKPVYRTE